MNITEKETFEIRSILSRFLGREVSAKRLFIGYGMFCDKIMFGIYHQGYFYLKAENEFAKYLEQHGAVPWQSMESNPKSAIANYYCLPKAITSNTVFYQQIVCLSYKQITQKQLSFELAKKEKIKSLPNLSIKHERLLSKIGITQTKELREIGASTCFVRLKAEGFSVSIELFWRLLAALKNKHMSLLTPDEKTRALDKLNEKLAEAGFRKMKGD
ncbi:regulator of competence-specific genes [Mesocricetibacter intestinalis]|uniref:Regulator of competence-specific genes n=1 Tax=Mesocricetibacter intestinalis TaxID=1521930 RepID=A0A4R6VB94_9PAST|nr:TfoX/Sxy family DNA transformation protein [Mesocricetibacter intestinalis]TDQ56860.1 regulator of competence-specific genes [Mesocricetibacter intestinalis]